MYVIINKAPWSIQKHEKYHPRHVRNRQYIENWPYQVDPTYNLCEDSFNQNCL
jgi:hypothetical protein